MAVALVVLHHLDQGPGIGQLHTAGGSIGVDLFFVLSGFLITRLLIEEHGGAGAIDLRAFYRRRAVRLLPALYVMLAAALVLSVVFDAMRGSQPKATIWALLYVANWPAAIGGWETVAPIAHLWSLAVEEQFYLVWPVAVIAVLRRWNVSVLGTLSLSLAVLLACSTAIRAGLGVSVNPLLYASTEAHGAVLLLGGAWLATRPIPKVVPRTTGPLAVGALVALLLLTVFTTEANRLHFVTGFSLLFVVSVLLVRGALAPTTAVARVLSLRAAREVGRLSYGIYLWHVLVIAVVEKLLPGENALRLARLVLDVVVSVALAQLSSMTVERWAQRYRARPNPRTTAHDEIDLRSALEVRPGSRPSGVNAGLVHDTVVE
ncbi:MAG: acyltransferase family protein [Acidimicrobiia bacterium]